MIYLKDRDKYIKRWIENNFTDANSDDWFCPERFDKKIRPNLPPELEVIEPPPRENNYRCFIYAFGLRSDEKLVRFSQHNNLSGLAKHLILRTKLDRTEAPQEGDLIFYSEDKHSPIKHAGVVDAGGMIVSKWSYGPIIRHDVHHVNPLYGDCIRYYKKISMEKIKESLIFLENALNY